MKNWSTTIFFLIFSYNCNAQWLTQSADGTGTFLFKGSNVSFDITKSDFSFTINTLKKAVRVNKPKSKTLLFVGGGMNAKSEEGLGNLFSTGNLVPSASINGYTGIRFSNSYLEVLEKEREILSKNFQLKSAQQIDEYRAEVAELISHLLTFVDVKDQAIKDLTSQELLVALEKEKNNHEFQKFLQTYITSHSGVGASAELVLMLGVLQSKLKEIDSRQDQELDPLRQKIFFNHDQFVRRNLGQFSVFVFGGIAATSFKRVDEIDPANLSKSLISEDFRGGNAGIGVNWQLKRWSFGLTYNFYKKTNNLLLMDKTDYKLTKTVKNADGSETLTNEKSISAYSGKNPVYGEVKINELNADIMFAFDVADSAKTSAMIDLYLRSTPYSKQEDLLPKTYSIGIGTYFFTSKSKFLGGLYFELPDLNNAYEKLKPTDAQNFRSPFKRLTFGITSKFSLASLISVQ